MHPRYRRAIAVLLAPAVVTACQTWRVAELAPRPLVETKAPSRIRVTTPDGLRIEVAEPHVVGDSILGRHDGHNGPAVAVALADVTRVETPHVNVAGTVGLTLLVGVVVAVAVAGAVCHPSGYSPC